MPSSQDLMDPDDPDAAEARHMLTAVSARSGEETWTLQLHEDLLRGTADLTGASFEMRRDELLKRLELADGLFLEDCVSFKQPSHLLRFQPEGYRTLKDWIGKDLLLRSVLRTRLRWALPLGVVFLLLAVPIPGDPEAGIADVPFDWLNAILGASLIASGLLGQRWPHHRYLFMDALWWSTLTAVNAIGLLDGDHKGWILLLLIQLRFSYTGFRDWYRFRLGTY